MNMLLQFVLQKHKFLKQNISDRDELVAKKIMQ